MLERCIVMLGAFLGREMWGSRSLGWSLPKQVLWLMCLLIKAVCFLLLLCLGWGVWSLLSHLLELLSKFNLNLKIAVGLLKPHFWASLLLLKLHPAVLKSNPSSFSFGFSAERFFDLRGQDVSVVPGSTEGKVIASYRDKMLLQLPKSGGCFTTFLLKLIHFEFQCLSWFWCY